MRCVSSPVARWLRGTLAALACGPALAAHPFITEDPGTQGTGRIELELGAAARQGAPDVNGRETGFFPQLSLGVAPNVDLIALGIVVRQAPAQRPTLFGSGDLLLDVKWRFHESDTLGLAVRAGVDLPTGDAESGLGSGRVGWHAIGIAGWTLGDYAVYANAAYAYTRQPDTRANLGAFTVAVTRPDDAPLRAFVEAATFSNTDPANSQWPAVVRTGLIYTVNAWMDVDIGFQARLNRAATRQAWLVGATLRW